MDSNLKDYLTFKKMITPMVIQIVFWIWVVFIIIGGLGMMFTVSFFGGLGMILFGPILARISIELIIVMFEISEGIQTIAKRK